MVWRHPDGDINEGSGKKDDISLKRGWEKERWARSRWEMNSDGNVKPCYRSWTEANFVFLQIASWNLASAPNLMTRLPWFMLQIKMRLQILGTNIFSKFLQGKWNWVFFVSCYSWQSDMKCIQFSRIRIRNRRGDFLRSVPCVTVWHWNIKSEILWAREKMMKVQLVYVPRMMKKHSGHLPGLLMFFGNSF